MIVKKTKHAVFAVGENEYLISTELGTLKWNTQNLAWKIHTINFQMRWAGCSDIFSLK